MAVSIIQGVDSQDKLRTIRVSEDGRLLVGTSTSSTTSPAEAIALTPTIINLDLGQANTEEAIALTNVRLLEIYCRSAATLRYAFAPGRVGGLTPAGPYRTLPSGMSQPITLLSGCVWTGTLYLAADIDGAVVEIEVWG